MASCENILISEDARDVIDIPKIPIMDYVFKHLRAKMPILKDKLYLEAVDDGENIKFRDVEELTKRYASALTRLGFKKGDVLYYCTFNSNHLYLIRFAVWYLGGITKGWYPGDTKECHMISLKQTPPKIILIDEITGPAVIDALTELKMNLKVLCFGNVNGTIPVKKLLEDDGDGLPDKVEIDPMNDIMLYVCSSGSTGPPKTIPHTSYSAIAIVQSYPNVYGKKIFQYGTSSGISSNMLSLVNLIQGRTVLIAFHFKNELFINWLLKFKPDSVLMYTFLSNWFARTVINMNFDLSFIKTIAIGASVLDSETIKLLSQAVPQARILNDYGMAENYITCSTNPEEKYPKIYKSIDGDHTSCGKPRPYVQIKILDPATRRIVNQFENGEIYVKTAQNFLGYLIPGTSIPNKDTFDADGWFKTSDIGFYDEEFNLYVVDRANFLFKFRGRLISPSDIENSLGKHEAVLSCAVVPIPDKDNDNLARAYVVLRPGKLETVTERDLIDYVAENLNEYKQLHGGVRFIDKIPENKNGKIDRIALKKIVLADK